MLQGATWSHRAVKVGRDLWGLLGTFGDPWLWQAQLEQEAQCWDHSGPQPLCATLPASDHTYSKKVLLFLMLKQNFLVFSL